MFSNYLSVSVKQWIKGLVITVVGSVLGLIVQLLQSGTAINWSSVLMAGVIAGLSYIVHALGTDSNPASPTAGKFLGKV